MSNLKIFNCFVSNLKKNVLTNDLISLRARSLITQPQLHKKQNLYFPFISKPITGQIYGLFPSSMYPPFLAPSSKAGFGVRLKFLTSFKFFMWVAVSGSKERSKSPSRTDSLLYKRPNPHATIGGCNGSCRIEQCLHRYANSASLSFYKLKV